MNCATCGKDLEDRPERAVEDGELGEVIGHKHQPPKSAPSFVKSRREFYCSPDCFIESVVAGDSDE